jgi:hypothetical protein
MQLCIDLWMQGIAGAKEVDSKHYIDEARQLYDLLRVAWPGEDAVKKLQQHI